MNAQSAAPPGCLAAPGEQREARTGNDARVPRPPTKRQRVLHALLRGPATTFDLERLASDHCAPSTISELRRDGLTIHSEIVAVPGYGGQPAHVARYTLDGGSRDRAIELMTRGRRRGTAA